MKRWMSLVAGVCLLAVLLVPPLATELAAATNDSTTVATSAEAVFSVEDYEAYAVGINPSLVSLFDDGTGQDVTDAYNHTDGGDKALRLPMTAPFGDTYARIPIKVDATTITAKKGEGYAVSFYVTSDTDGVFTYALGTVATLSVLDSADKTAYTADEKHGAVSLKAGEWQKVTVLAGSLKGPAATAEGESFYLTLGGGFAEGKDASVYLDDVIAVPMQEWLDAHPILPQSSTAGLYINGNSAVYNQDGVEYAAMRLYASYTCAQGDMSAVSYGNMTLPIVERGILFGKATDALVYGDSTTYLTASSTTEDFHKCWSYDEATATVRYGMLVNGISFADRTTAYAYRTYMRVSIDGAAYLLYSNPYRALTAQKLYDGRDVTTHGYLAWFSAANLTQNYDPTTPSDEVERIPMLTADFTSQFAVFHNYVKTVTQNYPFIGEIVTSRPNATQQELMDMAVDLSKQLSLEIGTAVSVNTDNSTEQTYEIVLGINSKRSASSTISQSLPSDDAYIIKEQDNKVYIVAKTNAVLKVAIEKFITTVCRYNGCYIPKGYEYTSTAKVGPYTLGDADISDYVIRVEKYPTYMVQRAAEALQARVYKAKGYLIPIIPMTDDGSHYEYEIQVGPMNGSVKLSRVYDTAFTAETAQSIGQMEVDDDGFIHDKGLGYYKIGFVGNHLVLNGGSSYAVDAAMQQLIKQLNKNPVLPKDYTLTGTYTAGQYGLSGGYDLQWQDEFSYDTTNAAQTDKEMREYWTISNDDATGPVIHVDEETGEKTYGSQYRPGVYGENWWVWKDTTGNGHLLQVTKRVKTDTKNGYDAGRLVSGNKWSFRYGIWETRIVMGTRNGSCSAIWANSEAPDSVGYRNEIDVYENFGKDSLKACYHTWNDPEGLNAINYGSKDGHRQHNGQTYNTILHNEITPADGEHFWDTYHSMSIEWTPNGIEFYLDGTKFDRIYSSNIGSRSMRKSTTIKFANGVGTSGYTGGNDPIDWMNEAYTAETGKTPDDFFEIQLVDYSRIYQTSNVGKGPLDTSYFVFAQTHPSNENYNGYLKTDDSFVSAQAPQ